MKDIINEFQSNLPPSTRQSVETIFFRSLPARAYRESSFREQKILIMTYLTIDCSDGDALDKPEISENLRNWEDNRDVVIEGYNFANTPKYHLVAFPFFLFSLQRETNLTCVSLRETRNWQYSVSNRRLAQRDDLSSPLLGKAERAPVVKRWPMRNMREIGRGKGNENIYSANEIGSEWERLTGVMHRAGARSWRTAREFPASVPVIPSRLSRLANGELVRSRDRPTSCTRCCATLLSSSELW